MFLSFKNVCFSYGKRPVLNKVSFEVKSGSIFAIVGSSGSGKSTILRLIAGLLQENNENIFNGKILIDGKTPLEYQQSGLLTLMFQSPNLFPNLSVRENISLPLEIMKCSNMELVDQMLNVVGLSAEHNILPRKLSGGMKTRVALARAFITRPQLLLLDEPFTALDVAWKDVLYAELKELSRRFQTTVILVTHDIEEATLLADKILCLGIDG
jgi:ABC-type nitrate/sulfonate/bicarbonate transport system ATPase subunit